jgi:hypothetical protein
VGITESFGIDGSVGNATRQYLKIIGNSLLTEFVPFGRWPYCFGRRGIHAAICTKSGSDPKVGRADFSGLDSGLD